MFERYYPFLGDWNASSDFLETTACCRFERYYPFLGDWNSSTDISGRFNFFVRTVLPLSWGLKQFGQKKYQCRNRLVRTVLPLSWGLKLEASLKMTNKLHNVRTVLPLSWGLKQKESRDFCWAAVCSNGITPFLGIETCPTIQGQSSEKFVFERYYPFLGDWNFVIHFDNSFILICSNGITPFLGIETLPSNSIVESEQLRVRTVLPLSWGLKRCDCFPTLYCKFLRSNGITPFLGIETHLDLHYKA